MCTAAPATPSRHELRRPLGLNTVQLLKAASTGLGLSPHKTMKTAAQGPFVVASPERFQTSHADVAPMVAASGAKVLAVPLDSLGSRKVPSERFPSGLCRGDPVQRGLHLVPTDRNHAVPGHVRRAGHPGGARRPPHPPPRCRDLRASPQTFWTTGISTGRSSLEQLCYFFSKICSALRRQGVLVGAVRASGNTCWGGLQTEGNNPAEFFRL